MRELATLAAALLLALLLTSGCGGEPEPVATADIEPKVRLVSVAGVATEVTVVLFRQGSLVTTYQLRAGERLTVTPPYGEPIELTRGIDTSSWLRRNAYVGVLPPTEPGDELVIAFERSGERSAPRTTLRVPGELAVTRPGAGERRTIGESFSVAWEPLGGGQVEVRYDVHACEGLDGEDFEELRTGRGFASFPLADGDLGLTTTTFDAPSRATRCDADLLVGRTSDAIALDPAFGELRGSSRTVRVSQVLPLTFTQTTTVATADIEPKVRVVSTAGRGTEVTVVLFRAAVIGGATYALAVGERLTVTPPGGAPVPMVPGVDMSSAAQRDGYRATLSEVRPGEELVIALERPGVDAAPQTVVRIPGEIELVRPAPHEERTIGEPFTVEWTPLPSGQVELRFALQECRGLDQAAFEDLRAARGYPLALRSGDAGSTTVTFVAADAERCEAELLVGRTGDGIDLDPAFRGLRAASRAVRVSTPLPLVFQAAP
jgi:hypothetical protein